MPQNFQTYKRLVQQKVQQKVHNIYNHNIMTY